MAFLRKKMLLDMLREAAMPVGSFMWWFGLESKIPEGWLKLDGSSFDATEYPELYNILGSTTLPNMINKFIKGGNTGGVSQSAGLPSIGSSLKFTGTAATLTFSGNVSGTTNESGSHSHQQTGHDWHVTDSGTLKAVMSTGATGTGNRNANATKDAGNHSHTFSAAVSMRTTYTPSGTVSMTTNSIYGSSSTVTPANVSAIPIIKAREKVDL